ncbi:unnamed protein product [Brachionus calyciflorus]|uniref:Uncharacterized protein n=1 Tax=Brachionus calyciflorus TaxID=104777 RepID=A0A814BMV2_9BILA|nr:unnamed protein product [Brachionus calyciflorus]
MKITKKSSYVACTPINVERAIVEFYKSNNDQDYDLFMKMCLVKQNRQSVISKLVQVDNHENGFFINSPLDFHLIMNKAHKFRYHVDNAEWLKILNSEGTETPFLKPSNNFYELEYTPTTTGPLKVLVKRGNVCFILTSYEVVEKRKHIVIDSPTFLSTIV